MESRFTSKKLEDLDSEKSFARECFLSALRGEITEKERDRLVAGHASATLYDHLCFPVSRPSFQIETYVAARNLGTQEYDAVPSIRNGDWLHDSLRIISRNNHELEHVLWALNLCKEHGMGKEVALCEAHLAKYESCSSEMFKTIQNHLKAQERDSVEKNWKSSAIETRRR